MYALRASPCTNCGRQVGQDAGERRGVESLSGERGGEKGGAEAINEVHQLIKKIANTNQSVRNQRISDEQCSMGAAGFIVDP